jgi:hypothetical protein
MSAKLTEYEVRRKFMRELSRRMLRKFKQIFAAAYEPGTNIKTE